VFGGEGAVKAPCADVETKASKGLVPKTREKRWMAQVTLPVAYLPALVFPVWTLKGIII
jgi:hypothetical protein